jgi:2-polyprenyl-3-methyl-5-hydroxy-6-metoxy-1,4-benzoquinol methylase
MFSALSIIMKKRKENKLKKPDNDRQGDKISIPGSYQYDAYYNGPRMQRFWHYTRLKESETSLNISASDIVLDIGCGSGLLASFIASKNNVPVLAIDANKSAIDFCKSAYQLSNLSFEERTIDEIIFEENSFTKIVLLEVIEHITNGQAIKLLETIQRLLKPGGLLVISTPNKRSLWPAIEFLMDKFKLAPRMNKDQHEILYSSEQLSKLAANAGLKCVSKKTLLFLSPWTALLNWKLGLSVHRLEMKFKCRWGALLLFAFQK